MESFLIYDKYVKAGERFHFFPRKHPLSLPVVFLISSDSSGHILRNIFAYPFASLSHHLRAFAKKVRRECEESADKYRSISLYDPCIILSTCESVTIFFFEKKEKCLEFIFFVVPLSVKYSYLHIKILFSGMKIEFQ